ncbi:hypothetical protein FACS1894211_11160 [Clostridia bacterium]|nr:hypothetical protein FACS1894211_11160 [Clostridia bacterium]
MKKQSAIRQMFNGEWGREDLSKGTDEYWKLHEEVTKYDGEIRKKLNDSPKLLVLYEKVGDATDAMCAEENAAHYVEGFKFGLSIGLEIGESTET